MSRLAFVHLFFQRGIDQAGEPEPLNVGSVLTLHDAVEMFLQVVAEHRGIGLPRFVNFHDYWKKLGEGSKGVALPGERPMSKLNDVRTAFKHPGRLPSTDSVARACTDVRRFLEDSMRSVFGLAFDSIDMTEVIPHLGARHKVRAAVAAAVADDLTDAMGLLAEAFDQVIGGVPSMHDRRRPARFGNTIRPVSADELAGALAPTYDPRSASADPHLVGQAIADMMEATRDMQAAMRIMAFGIDFRKFNRFKRLTPSIIYIRAQGTRRQVAKDYAPTMDDFEFCHQFVVTAALRVAAESR